MRNNKAKPIMLQGKMFESVNAAARYYQLTPQTMRYRIKTYGKDDPRVTANKNNYFIDSEKIANLSLWCMQNHFNYNLARKYLAVHHRTSRKELAKFARKKSYKCSITINGIYYKNLSDLARKKHLNYYTLRSRYQRLYLTGQITAEDLIAADITERRMKHLVQRKRVANLPLYEMQDDFIYDLAACGIAWPQKISNGIKTYRKSKLSYTLKQNAAL